MKLVYDYGEGPVRPFIVAGIGLAKPDVEIDAPATGSDDDLVLAGSLEAGVSYAMPANAEVFADAEVPLLDEVTVDPTATGDANLSNTLLVSASVRLRWNLSYSAVTRINLQQITGVLALQVVTH